MAKNLKKYMDVDVVAFLEEQLKGNTPQYLEDIVLDKKKLAQCVEHGRAEDKTMLWLSGPDGTQLEREHDVFLKETYGNEIWQYYAQEEPEGRYVAFAVELSGVQDGVIRGNLFELDYLEHAEMVRGKAQKACGLIPIFQDGVLAPAEYGRDHLADFRLEQMHGLVVDSMGIPSDKALHAAVLEEQKKVRGEMVGSEKPLEEKLSEAQKRSIETMNGGEKEKEKEGLF